MFQSVRLVLSTSTEMKRLLVFVIMTLLLTSCGGGGGNSVSIFETPTLTAYYVDAPVKGLIYESSPSGLSGLTDEQGAFKFKQGDIVSFYIDPVNRIFIGKVSPTSEQVVIPPIANTFDPEVDASFVPLILYVFDRASAGSSYMDFSNFILNSSVANKVRNILARKSAPNLISDTWQSMASLQAEVAGYSFKNTGARLSKLEFNLNAFNSVSGIDALDVSNEDYLGAHYLSYGLAGAYFNFLPSGTLVGIRDDGTLASGTYVKNLNNISYRWDSDLSADCDYKISLRQRGKEWSLITIGESDTPNGCTHNINHNDALKKAKIKESVDIEYITGKNLRIPANSLCAFGDGEALFSVSTTGPSVNQRNVDLISEICTGNQLISGVVRESGIPGVLLFEFDSVSPRIKIFFGIHQGSGRALIDLSVEKTVPTTEFDFVYGAETHFTLY